MTRKRNNNKVKQLRTGSMSKARLLASRDISKECGEGKLYRINYLQYAPYIAELDKIFRYKQYSLDD